MVIDPEHIRNEHQNIRIALLCLQNVDIGANARLVIQIGLLIIVR